MVIAMRPSKAGRAVDGKLLSRLEWPNVVIVLIMTIVYVKRRWPSDNLINSRWGFLRASACTKCFSSHSSIGFTAALPSSEHFTIQTSEDIFPDIFSDSKLITSSVERINNKWILRTSRYHASALTMSPKRMRYSYLQNRISGLVDMQLVVESRYVQTYSLVINHRVPGNCKPPAWTAHARNHGSILD